VSEGRVVIGILQTGDEPLVLLAKLPTHQAGLTHHHHILQDQQVLHLRHTWSIFKQILLLATNQIARNKHVLAIKNKLLFSDIYNCTRLSKQIIPPTTKKSC
jgi:hypothetical protein